MFKLNEKMEIIAGETENIVILNKKKVLSMNCTGKEILDIAVTSNSIEDIISSLREKYADNLPNDFDQSIKAYVDKLLKFQIIGEA